MKKRVLSFVLVLVLVMTFFPFSAFASDTLTITKQPADAHVSAGETARFEIEVSFTGSSTPNYVWVDADKVDTDSITGITTFLTAVGDAKLGSGRVLELSGVTQDKDGMDFACVVYAKTSSFPLFTFVVSDTVTLHVNAAECTTHVLGANLVKVDAKEPTCAKEGNIEYYYCTVCGRYYVDADATIKTTLSACTLAKSTVHGHISHVDAAQGTCCDYGHTEYYQCDVCGQKFADAYGTQTVTNSSVQTAKVATNHKNLVEYPAVAATCSEKGNIQYWYCDGCKDYYSDAEGKNEISHAKTETDKDPYNHSNLVEYPAVAASCKAPGNIRYWYCSDCGDYFSDPLGHTEIKKSDTVLKQLAHTYDWYAMEQNGVEWHEYRCSECGTIDISGSHEGGEAGCRDKAVCDICGLEYGTTDPDNHKHLKREIIKEATLDEPGICNLYCEDCGRLLGSKVEYEYKDTCIHSLVLVEKVEPKCESYTEGDPYGYEEHYECEICGAWFADENGEEEITDHSTIQIEPYKHYINDYVSTLGITKELANPLLIHYEYNEIGHWQACKYCHYAYESCSLGHTTISVGGEAVTGTPTCCSHKCCVICDYDDGERDPDNHTGGTELRGACEPEGENPGYTGDEVCLGCGKVITPGRYYYAKCGECAKYLFHHDAVPSTCTKDGTKEYWECAKCGNIYLDANATQDADSDNLVDKCTGHEIHPGTDLLSSTTALTLATKLGWGMDELLAIVEGGNYSDLKNLTVDKLLENITIKDIDHCSDDTYHWLGCQKCGMSLAERRPYLISEGITISEKWYEMSEKQEHSGGTATCSSRAVCEVCGSEYGQLGEHRYDRVETPATCTTEGVVKYICNGCGDEQTEREEHYPALGHCFVKGYCSRGCGARITNPFYDVSNKDVFYTAIMWAYTYDPMITAGTDEHHFSPYADCTRGQVVTFLWRAAGQPEPETTVNPFPDVSKSSPFYKAILWASENGITSGYGDGTFRPNKTVSRAEFVTFLWRFFGEPAPSTNRNPFVDVSETSAFRTAILWAYGAEIASGYDDTHFQPNKTCNRWQVVMFMYRAIGEAKAYQSNQ